MSMIDADLTQFTERGAVSGKLLAEALKTYKQVTKEKIVAILRDNYGVFGYNMERAVLTAKKEPFYDIVSCHKRALFSALNTKKPLVIFMKDNNAYYKFNPEEILKADPRINERAEAPFFNFPISLGKRIISV